MQCEAALVCYFDADLTPVNLTIMTFYAIVNMYARGNRANARIRRFALMFLRDSSMDELRTAMSETNYEKAFQAAHTLKGVCLNLGLKGLYEPTAKITEMLRNSKYDEAEQMMEELEAEYKCHCENLSALEEA